MIYFMEILESVASLRTIAEGTRNNPRQPGSQIPDTFVYAKDMLVVFSRELKVPVASMRRLR
jgi:hypothetical protein